MSNQKILASLSYFSIFFAPFLLPVIVYFVADDQEVKFHAKRSLISHLAPILILIAGFFIFSFSWVRVDFSMYNTTYPSFWSIAPFIFLIIYGVLSLIIIIWNIYQGIKVLKK